MAAGLSLTPRCGHNGSSGGGGGGPFGVPAGAEGLAAGEVDALFRRLLAAREVAEARLESTPALPSLEGWDGGWGDAAAAAEEGGEGEAGSRLSVEGAADAVLTSPRLLSRIHSAQSEGGAAPAAEEDGAGSGGGRKRRAEGELGREEVRAWRRERCAALGVLGAGRDHRGEKPNDVISGG